ncbi:hypothetical protein [Achromobacter sp.]|uniref:hypothetical protein n=1 Tax=Achromobacter sp. TaxID=134375 RepID=UPI0028AA916C|nr:hypothetical protein [Achromobacter sp.]
MQENESRDTMTLLGARASRWARYAAANVNRGDAIAALLFLLATTAFSVVSVRMMGSQAGLSFYGLLRLLNGGDLQGAMGGQGAGIYALLWLLAMVGPLLPSLLPHRAARLGYFAPLALWGIAIAGVASQVREFMGASRQLAGFMGSSRGSRNMAQDMAGALWDSLSFGFGFYLSLAIMVGFTLRGIAAWRRRA